MEFKQHFMKKDTRELVGDRLVALLTSSCADKEQRDSLLSIATVADQGGVERMAISNFYNGAFKGPLTGDYDLEDYVTSLENSLKKYYPFGGTVQITTRYFKQCVCMAENEARNKSQ